ncbi:hypothetical protein VPHK373_0087 [Vibrio phage K373]
MITQLDKSLVGKYIYGYPTGNNIDRQLHRSGESQKITSFYVVSVGRKYLELKASGFNHCDKYNLDGATQSCVNSGFWLNAGYKFFKSIPEIDKWHDKNRKIREIGDFFSRGFKLDDESIEEVYLIISR